MSRSREHSVQFGLTSICLVLFTSSVVAGKTLNLEEGASCGTEQVCMKITECDSVNKDIGFRQKINTCGFDQNHLPILCCSPKVTDRSPLIIPEKKTISEKMCEKYAAYVFAPLKYSGWTLTGSKPARKGQDMCGRVSVPLITGGNDAVTREFPHMVQIGYGSPRAPPISRNAWLCGGSLISERFVLSAAHCTFFKITPSIGRRKTQEYGGLARWARMGVVDTTQTDRGPPPLILRIVQWINRTDYTSSGYNDIVLFKLEKDVILSPNVRPICLQVDQYIEETIAIATGWGKLFHGSKRLNTNILQKVYLKIVENDECNKIYKNGLYSQGIKDTQLCAGDQTGEDTCQGDSGGPLQIGIKHPYCMYSLIGITSGGGKCGSGNPGIYTRVSKYIPWIEEHVWPNEK